MNQKSAALRFEDFLSLKFAARGGPLTQILSQRIGAVFAYLAFRARLTPSQVTVLGGAVFLLTAWLYSHLESGFLNAALCALLFQLAFGLDCADGQLARSTKKTSMYGAWLDIATDYVRNVALAFALLIWLVRSAALPLEAAAGVCGLLLGGLVVILHTTVAQRELKSLTELPVAGRLSVLRRIFAWGVDTPTYLLILCLLRDAGPLLALFLGGMGAVLLFTAAYLARVRLPGPT